MISNYLCSPEPEWKPEEFKLAEKKLTTLRLKVLPMPVLWPKPLLQRLQTLELTLTGNPDVFNEYWRPVQGSTTLRVLDVALKYGTLQALSHPTVQRLSLAYGYTNQTCLLEEVKMPCLQTIAIDTSYPQQLLQLKLVDTRVLSLRLICRFAWPLRDEAVDITWVDGVVHLLRSTPHLEKMKITAPSCLVSGLLEALERDENLCAELKTFTISDPVGMKVVTGITKRTVEARFNGLRGRAATFMDSRRSVMSARSARYENGDSTK